MKKSTFLFVIVLLVTLFSCKQDETETTESVTTNFSKKIIVESFTGVRCVGCPAGNDELESLIDVYGDDLIVVSLHPDDFGTPFTSSQYDFRTTEAEEITEYISRPAFYPSAVINRKDFDGGDYNLHFDQNTWAGLINQELEADPKLSVNILKNYDSVTRELFVDVSGVAQVDIIGDLKLTIMITENNIVDTQVTENSGYQEDYIHKHVFRTTMTASKGDLIVSNLMTGESYEGDYSLTLPEEWNAENCEVVAFVNLIDGQSKEVLQADSKQIEN